MSISETRFTPVPRMARHDGWSAEKQQAFIEALADCGIVRLAAAKVQMGHASAYRLRHADGAEGFARAWDEALETGMAQLQDIAMERAIEGTPVPHFYKGQQVGESRFYDNRLLMFMLKQTNTRRFGPKASHYDEAEAITLAREAEEAKRQALIERAEAMIALLDEEMERCNHPEPNEDGSIPDLSEEFEALDEKRNKMDAMLEDLRAKDVRRDWEENLDRLEAHGQMSAHAARSFKKRRAQIDRFGMPTPRDRWTA